MKAPMNQVVDMLDDIINHIDDVQNHQVDRGYTQKRKDFFKKVLWFIKHSTVLGLCGEGHSIFIIAPSLVLAVNYFRYIMARLWE